VVDNRSTLGRRPPGLPPWLNLPFTRLSLAREARSWHAVCPCGAPWIGQPPSGPCQHVQRPARILVRGALRKRRRGCWKIIQYFKTCTIINQKNTSSVQRGMQLKRQSN
jgi:hypothetical protein